MRYAKDHKNKTHRQIVKIASEKFRQEGIDKVSIPIVMKEASLTVGGFYSHFNSKEDLITEALSSAADETLFRLFKVANDAYPDGLKALLEAYLSTEHCNDVKTGCILASLASELKNRPAKTIEVIAEKTGLFIRKIADLLPSSVNTDKRIRVASSVLGLMVGTLQIARIIPNKEISQQILKDGIANALKLTSEIDI